MGLGERLRRLRVVVEEEQQFRPSPWAVFFNPNYIIRRALYREIRRFAPRMGGKMLDFGAGKMPYRDLFDTDTYVGLDVTESGFPRRQKRAGVFFDGKTVPFADASFDSLLASESLAFIFDVDRSLSEIARVLKPGGLVLVTVPFMWRECEPPYDFGRYTSFGLAHLLRKHGFEILEQRRVPSQTESIAQTLTIYLGLQLFPERPRLLRLLLTIFVYAPVHIIAMLVSYVFKGDASFFLNNVVLAQRSQDQ